MIRRLTERDAHACLQFIKQQPSENLFIIGDIEAYGFEQPFQKLWGEFNNNGEFIAVLLKYHENFIPYAKNEFDAQGFAEIILNEPNSTNMSGLKPITEKIEPFLNQRIKRKRQTYYAKCTQISSIVSNMDTSIVQKAAIEDVESIVKLLTSIPEFSESLITIEKERKKLEDEVGRTYYILDHQQIVSTAATTAENSLSAMVVGVATLEAFTKKGYATKCVTHLCRELLQEGKELCLFYDNPEAGAIYKRIGFTDIGLWMMYTLKKK
ncbi:GNAT family N-acetyltransferase [Cytobacillus sp. Hz8]|uniref:GNAT family N-acetyltransferase n=1 Tax=Cytobacillus sp. Hz8 TaxID=3347168 RepID=UPI0035E34289